MSMKLPFNKLMTSVLILKRKPMFMTIPNLSSETSTAWFVTSRPEKPERKWKGNCRGKKKVWKKAIRMSNKPRRIWLSNCSAHKVKPVSSQWNPKENEDKSLLPSTSHTSKLPTQKSSKLSPNPFSAKMNKTSSSTGVWVKSRWSSKTLLHSENCETTNSTSWFTQSQTSTR